jgi:ketosteroid isomerase-like protein
MKYSDTNLFTRICTALLFVPIFGMLPTTATAQEKYVPDDPALYKAIVRLDSIFFDAYNHCDTKLAAYGAFYAEDLEFYHDKGGLMQSKKDVVDATKKNICGKVTRHLKPGSIEVYPIKDWGAIEIGMHQFHNKAEPDAVPHDSKFIVFWKNNNGDWKITKVVSLH